VPGVSPAVAPLSIVRRRELGDWIRALAWDAAADRVVVACADGRVAAVAADGEIDVVHTHPGGALDVAVSRDGVVASGGEDGRLVIAGAAHDLGGGWVEHVAWRPDGRLLAATHRREVSFWSADGTRAATSAPLPATVACIDWHPRGVTLAAGSYGGVRLLRGRDGHETDHLDWTGSVLALAYSPDGHRLAHGNQDASVHFWDLRHKRELEMTGYPLKVRQLAWSPDGRRLATGGSDVVTVWSFAGRGPAGSRPRELEHHDGRLTALAYQPDGELLASAAEDGLVLLWDAAGDVPLGAAALGAAVTGLRWTPDGTRLAAVTASGTVAVIDGARP